jgi:hypothetical protein
MLKGRDIAIDVGVPPTPLSAAEKSGFSPVQDTLHSSGKQIVKKAIEIQTVPKKVVTSTTSKTNYSNRQLDSLFKVTEKREKQVAYTPQIKIAETDSVRVITDTLRTKHNLYNYPFTEPKALQPAADNFLLHIPAKTLLIADQPIKIGAGLRTDTIKIHKTIPTKQTVISYLPGKERVQSNLDGFTIAIVFSLFVLSWMKMVYQKFIVQIVSSIVDYQVAMRLYRERNVLFRNVSIGLHFIFYINMGLFIFYLMDYYNHSQQLFQSNFISILVYSAFVFIVYNIKSLTSKILGHIFEVQENFMIYSHNINLYNKNIGLFLFPIIILYPFINEKFKPLIIYAGLLLLFIMFLLRSYRSAQIIIRKGISLFYLILYLCAIEILPVLLLVKVFSTLV